MATPRQLAPSVGKKSAEIMVAPAPSAMNIDTPMITGPIRFGSFDYNPHPPATRSVYDDLYGGMWLVFGNMQIHVN